MAPDGPAVESRRLADSFGIPLGGLAICRLQYTMVVSLSNTSGMQH